MSVRPFLVLVLCISSNAELHDVPYSPLLRLDVELVSCTSEALNSDRLTVYGGQQR